MLDRFESEILTPNEIKRYHYAVKFFGGKIRSNWLRKDFKNNILRVFKIWINKRMDFLISKESDMGVINNLNEFRYDMNSITILENFNNKEILIKINDCPPLELYQFSTKFNTYIGKKCVVRILM